MNPLMRSPALAVVISLACATLASGQTLSLTAGEIRHGEFGRQDGAGLEATTPAGPLVLYANAMGRHGDVDDGNSGLPWLTVTAGTHPLALGSFRPSAVVGFYSTPMSGYGTWEPVAGPRIDVVTGTRWALHFSHYWRRRGLVRTRMTEWTARTLFAIQWRVVG